MMLIPRLGRRISSGIIGRSVRYLDFYRGAVPTCRSLRDPTFDERSTINQHSHPVAGPDRMQTERRPGQHQITRRERQAVSAKIPAKPADRFDGASRHRP
jgi:hypothetical protein